MKNRCLVLVLLFAITACSGQYKLSEVCTSSSLSEVSTLEVKLVDKMTKGYINNQLKRINNSNKRDYSNSSTIKTSKLYKKRYSNSQMNDAQAIWFDFKALKDFLYHIENYANNNSKLQVDNLGIRIYYTSYPSSIASWDEFEDLKEVPKEYKNKHTLIFVPTIREGSTNQDLFVFKESYINSINNVSPENDSSNSDIIIVDPNANNGTVAGSDSNTGGLTQGDPSPKDSDRIMVLGVFKKGEFIAKNHGSLWPPHFKYKNGKRFPLEN